MSNPEIAVMTGTDGRTISFDESGTVVIFRRVSGAWQDHRTVPFSIENETSLAGLRQKMGELIASLGPCRTVVAKSATGAVFFELEKARCSVWEVSGEPEDFLDSVWMETNQEMDVATIPRPGQSIPSPIEKAPGKFTISIKEIQGKRPEISSKQILQQFIRKGGFIELEIVCDHPPPWIDVEAERLGMTVETSYPAPDEVCMVLKKSPDAGCC